MSCTTWELGTKELYCLDKLFCFWAERLRECCWSWSWSRAGECWVAPSWDTPLLCWLCFSIQLIEAHKWAKKTYLCVHVWLTAFSETIQEIWSGMEKQYVILLKYWERFRMRSHFYTPLWHSLLFRSGVRWTAMSTCARNLRQEGAGLCFSAAPPQDQGCSQGWAVWPSCLPAWCKPASYGGHPETFSWQTAAWGQLLACSYWLSSTGRFMVFFRPKT